jgi:hypothetical protein
VEDVATAVVVESPAPVSVGLPPSAAELRSRAQRQARVTPEPLITAEFPSGVGVAIGEVQSETESDYTNDHDEEEYSADHEAESPSSHQKPLRVWGNVVAPLKVTSELLSPTGDVAPVMEPLAVDEYSADDFVPEEEAVDPVEALLQSAPAVLNDFEVTEATLPPHEPYKPIGLPPPPRFPQRGFSFVVLLSFRLCCFDWHVFRGLPAPPSSTHSAPESIPAPPKQPPPPLPKSRPPPPPVPPSVPGARVSPKVTPTATPKAPIPLLDEVSPEKVDLPTKAVIPPPPPPPPVPPSVVSLSPASSPGTRVSLRTPRLGLASPTIGSIAGTVSTHPESGQGSATTSSPAVPQTVTVTPLEPEAYASDASSHSDGNSTSADELPVGHPPRHHTDFTEESSVEEEDNLSPASDADSQHSSDVHSVATSVDDSDTSVILDDLSSRLSSFTDASESAIARASAMGYEAFSLCGVGRATRALSYVFVQTFHAAFASKRAKFCEVGASCDSASDCTRHWPWCRSHHHKTDAHADSRACLRHQPSQHHSAEAASNRSCGGISAKHRSKASCYGRAPSPPESLPRTKRERYGYAVSSCLPAAYTSHPVAVSARPCVSPPTDL